MNKIKKKNVSMPVALLIILLLSAVMVGLQMFMQITDPAVAANFYKAPLLFVFNLLPVFMCMVALYFITNSICISYGITGVFIFALLTVNNYKVYFRDEPLIPNDFNLFNEATTILKNYDIVISMKVVATGLAIVALTVLSALFVKSRKPKWYVRLAGILCVVAISVVSVKYIYHNQWLYDSFVICENQYNDVSMNNSRGLIYSFLYKTTNVYYKKPDGYTPQKAEEYMAPYGKEFDKGQKMPNIIAIMSEAFFDPSIGENVEYYNGKNPMKEYNKLKKEALYGTLVVPGFAGGTSSTEFEFLSGANLSLLDKSLPTVYKTHITKNMYCLPYMLNEMGFRSVAIHPGDKWFYNRQNVYRRMGFEKFITKDDLPDDVEKVNWYISDKVTSGLIIDEYKEHLEKYPDKNYFNFTVTIQNHGPYRDYELFGEPAMKPIDGMSDELYNIVNNYMYGLEDAVALLKDVTDFTRTLDEPTVVVFFGDHLPYFDGDFIGYDNIGVDFNDDSLETVTLKHSVPYMIWGNDAAKKQISDNGGKVMTGDYGYISSNFLSVLMMKYINMKMPPFYDYVNNIFEEVQVIAPTYFYDGEFDMFYKGEQLEKLKGYKYLQYYNMRNY